MTKWHGISREMIQNSHPGKTKKEFIYNISWGTGSGAAAMKSPASVPASRFSYAWCQKGGPFSGPRAIHLHPLLNSCIWTASTNVGHYRALPCAAGTPAPIAQRQPRYRGSHRSSTYNSLTRLMPSYSTRRPKPVSNALRQDLLSYYADLEKPFATKRNSKAWRAPQGHSEIDARGPSFAFQRGTSFVCFLH
jgi:hypothetical protein